MPPKEAIGPVFTFVSDGIVSALAKAKEMVGDKNIALIGANIQQQFVLAGLIDEIHVDVVSVLLCEGVRLFDPLKGFTPLQVMRKTMQASFANTTAPPLPSAA